MCVKIDRSSVAVFELIFTFAAKLTPVSVFGIRIINPYGTI